MAWADLLAFIGARDAGFLSAVQGVPLSEIDRCQELCSIVLPRFYVEYLKTMGADSGGFRPFGATQAADFRELADQLPPRHYPAHHFFKVSEADDPSGISPPDTFIDLWRSDDEDAPLVWFEDGGGFSEAGVTEVGLSLGEQMTASAFDFFEVGVRRETSRLMVFAESGREVKRNLQRALEVLEAMGLRSALPALPRVMCLRNDAVSALVEISEETDSVSVKLGAEDMRSLAVAIEQLRDRFPDAIVEGSTNA